jgi:chromosome partitioning protein
MAIIALANLKGGVGKSTLAVNIAGALAPKSALLDADPQATATAWAEAGNLPFPVTESALTGANVEAWIDAALRIDAAYVVIDLPPMLGDATAAALAIADLAVIPVTASGADLKATNRAIELIAAARESRGDGKPAVLMVPSKVDIRTAAGAEIQAVLHDYGEPVGPPGHVAAGCPCRRVHSGPVDRRLRQGKRSALRGEGAGECSQTAGRERIANGLSDY